MKNRDRKSPTFANINLIGPCNFNCYFCIGKDVNLSANYNYIKTNFKYWGSFCKYLELCKINEIYKIYITGLNCDPFQYFYLGDLIDFLKEKGFVVGVRTNGYLCLKKTSLLKKFNGGISYTILSLDKGTHYKITGVKEIPNWKEIIPKSGENVRIAIVINKYNIREIMSLLEFASSFKNINYIQLRKISTDNRFFELKEDQIIFDKFFEEFKSNFKKVGSFFNSDEFMFKNKRVCFWKACRKSCSRLVCKNS